MRPPRLTPEALRQALRDLPIASAAELAQRLQVSQPTVSRGLAALGEGVVRIGRTRAARYALSRSVDRLGASWPLHTIDADGRPHTVGRLHALQGSAWYFDSGAQHPYWLRGEFSQGLFPDLPWFLEDLRPQGFLGRAFAQQYAEELDAPADLGLWHGDHVLTALLRHGHNLPGRMVLGDAMLERALQEIIRPPNVVDVSDRADSYLRRAEAALQGQPVGSSAGGEQPKFTAVLREADGEYRGTVIKFSEPGESVAAIRWADLLYCEHLAGTVLQSAGIAAAATEIIDAGGRRFLQSTRFDRSAELGRRGYLSLRALAAAYLGRARAPWVEMADLLLAQGWLSGPGAETLRCLGLFGEMIGNSDMHFGNLAFEFADHTPFKLLPVFDMLPMLYAPGSTGAVIERRFEPPVPLPRYQHAWQTATTLAVQFWSAVSADAAISAPFRTIAAANGDKVARLLQRFG